MSDPSVVVLGSFMMDLMIRAPRRPGPGETVIGTDFEMFLGGKGFNQAVAAARAGVSTTMIGHLGCDELGDRFMAQLGVDGIDASHVHRHPEIGTGIGVPLVEDSGENSIVVVPRANLSLTAEHVVAAREALAAATVLLVQFELPFDTVCTAARVAREEGTTVICNPAPAGHDLSELRGLVDIIVPNRAEAAALAGRPISTDPGDLARELQADTGAVAVVTLGDKGTFVLDGAGSGLVPAHDVAIVDSVGAGDAFCGMLAALVAEGHSIEEAVVWANAAGALAVTRMGAEPSMPTRQAVRDLLSAGGSAATTDTENVAG